MKAIDTNLIVRLLVRDHAEQAEVAVRIIGDGVFVPVTVLLETGWVLDKFYRQPRHLIADALVALLDMPTIHVADEPGIRHALELFRRGADFGDVIHMAAAGSCEAFITFDRKLARTKDVPLPVELAA